MPLILPNGFSITIFAKNIPNARVLIKDQESNILVSSPKEGKVFTLPDKNNDGAADENVEVISNLNEPHGLAFHPQNKNKLYIAENNQVAIYDYDLQTMKASNKKKIIDLPLGSGHSTRTIIFTPDGKLLTSIGSTCNVCNEEDNRRAKIMISNDDGSDFRPYASGLRNSVFMTINPKTREVFVTEMGRDALGDDIPPDEINIIKDGKNYGWPFCYGKQIQDTNFSNTNESKQFCQQSTPTTIDLQAHSAPLGLTFLTSKKWPSEYQNNLFVAYHGSWNRSVPTGYKIVRHKFDNKGNYLGAEDFITGWLKDRDVSGRPTGILQKDDALFIADDKAEVVYRVGIIEK
ncbi:hypothetical protein A3F08_02970 [Candidatus Berkelbacteria bacterium RIFCSPHIGHO2_12_FULL_36_9]|uniref:Pyrroloquinoline quinone-dependent pyranose dehydrogenase beta-propeller domain-containing protein n=1 Tax=Candidatus Berkelbacteria bacterium RIFCSPHIGHO2_12_FULL_36_9 TaxID=1797469 RepID=A0A1F5EE93_9BACT|nr:MAG: hypothetical protein A3F08_02970 [Candidatus Berkelbacteria bacterium RIFCSPHIGHO2_12_FULL_36_9]